MPAGSAMRRASRRSQLRSRPRSQRPAASVDVRDLSLLEYGRIEQVGIDAHPSMRRWGQRLPVGRDSAILAAEILQEWLGDIASHIAIKLAADAKLARREVDAAEPGHA